MAVSSTIDWDPSVWAPGCERSSLQFTHPRYTLIQGGRYYARLIWGNPFDDYYICGLGEKTGFSLAKSATTNSYPFIDDSPIIPQPCSIPWGELCSSCIRSTQVSTCFSLSPWMALLTYARDL